MYIRGLIPRNFAELAEAVPIEKNVEGVYLRNSRICDINVTARFLALAYCFMEKCTTIVNDLYGILKQYRTIIQIK